VDGILAIIQCFAYMYCLTCTYILRGVYAKRELWIILEIVEGNSDCTPFCVDVRSLERKVQLGTPSP
jgi:hypothetical protein